MKKCFCFQTTTTTKTYNTKRSKLIDCKQSTIVKIKRINVQHCIFHIYLTTFISIYQQRTGKKKREETKKGKSNQEHNNKCIQNPERSPVYGPTINVYYLTRAQMMLFNVWFWDSFNYVYMNAMLIYKLKCFFFCFVLFIFISHFVIRQWLLSQASIPFSILVI